MKDSERKGKGEVAKSMQFWGKSRQFGLVWREKGGIFGNFLSLTMGPLSTK